VLDRVKFTNKLSTLYRRLCVLQFKCKYSFKAEEEKEGKEDLHQPLLHSSGGARVTPQPSLDRNSHPKETRC